MQHSENFIFGNRMLIFLDGSPTDWLTGNNDWHTFAFLGHWHDEQLTSAVENLQSVLPSKKLQKWGKRGNKRYRLSYIKEFPNFCKQSGIWVNAVSFREQTLLDNYEALLEQYNQYRQPMIIGFGSSTDNRGRKILSHQFVHGFCGLRRVEFPESKLLVLLTLAWLILDQCVFYYRNMLKDGFPPNVNFTIITDNFSGDSHLKRDAGDALQDLLTHQRVPSPFEPWFEITTSPISVKQSGDFIVDNMAGWLNHCATFPQSQEALLLQGIPDIANYVGWKEIVVNEDNNLILESRL